MKELEKEFSEKVDFKTIDISKDFVTAQKYGVQSSPTIVIVDSSGAIADTLVVIGDKEDIKMPLERVIR